MKAPATPRNEKWRLDALVSLQLLDTPRESDFDALVHVGQALFKTPICLVSLIDQDRQWFKGCVGLETRETSRSVSFCGHAILKPEVFVVLDALKDKRFHDNPLVTGPPNIRFYAGAPIRLPSGYAVGTFCVISPEPRNSFGEAERALLKRMAHLTLNAIAVRGLRGRMDENQALASRYQSTLHMAKCPVALVDAKGIIQESNAAFAALCAVDAPDGMSVQTALPISRRDWTPKRMIESGAIESTIRLKGSGTELRVARDAGGFVFVGA
jgi:PAS domain-containing protein